MSAIGTLQAGSTVEEAATVLPPQVANPVAEGDIPDIDLPEISPRVDENDDLYEHCHQRISRSGRIFVSRKAWMFRVLFLVGFVAFLAYNLKIAFSVGDYSHYIFRVHYGALIASRHYRMVCFP